MVSSVITPRRPHISHNSQKSARSPFWLLESQPGPRWHISCRLSYPCASPCNNANPHGKDAGAAFYGGPEETGPFNGLQAQKARIPLANANLVKLPDNVSDDQAILLSDILPTGYFGADMANIKSGKTVAVFGCGPVGQFAIASALHLGAGQVIAVDIIPDRLAMARKQGAEVVDFDKEDPARAIKKLTGGIGSPSQSFATTVESGSPRPAGRGEQGVRIPAWHTAPA